MLNHLEVETNHSLDKAFLCPEIVEEEEHTSLLFLQNTTPPLQLLYCYTSLYNLNMGRVHAKQGEHFHARLARFEVRIEFSMHRVNNSAQVEPVLGTG